MLYAIAFELLDGNVEMKYLFLLVFIIFTSCASMKNLEKPQPDNKEGVFYTVRDGTQLFVYSKLPLKESNTIIYVISGITGINHKVEKDIIELLSAGKNRVVVIHPRGTGYSEGKRGDISKFKDFINDYVEIIADDLKSLPANHKIILYGHSISTAISLMVADSLPKIDGIILVNPPYKMKSSKGMTPSIREYLMYVSYYIFASHTPIVNMSGNPSKIENEEERKEAEMRNQDPLLVKYFSMYYMAESRKMMNKMLDYAKRAKYSLLLIYGNDDSLVDKSGCDEIFSAWLSMKQYEVVKNGPHGKKTVILSAKKIQAWINEL